MNKLRAIPFILSLLLLLTGCSTRTITIERTDEVMGTIMTLTLCGSSREEASLNNAMDAAFLRLRELEQIFSTTIDDSEINNLNQTAAQTPVAVSDEMFEVLTDALYYAELTDGAFDPTLGRLIALWNIGSATPSVPTDDVLTQEIGRHNYRHIQLDADAQTVTFTSADFSLDLGAIAKGYAADELEDLLTTEYGVKQAILNLGGNVLVIGSKSGNTPWNIGITDPQAPPEAMALVKVSDCSVVTSGDYQRYFESSEGVRYHHILDAATGYPADQGITSVTIITASSMRADALSTALFVLGVEKGLALIESLEDVEAVFISSNNDITLSPGLNTDNFSRLY